MNKDQAIKILEETVLLKRISDYVRTHYEYNPNPTSRIRVGQVHTEILDGLDIKKSPTFYKVMQTVYHLMGWRRATVNGKCSYKYCQKRR